MGLKPYDTRIITEDMLALEKQATDRFDRMYGKGDEIHTEWLNERFKMVYAKENSASEQEKFMVRIEILWDNDAMSNEEYEYISTRMKREW